MSDFRAIAAVSSSIRNLLDAEMELQAAVSIAAPDVDVTGITGKRVNLFLYKVEENAALKNMDLPGRGHAGAYGRPPLSLDLHYLMTAYGGDAEEELETQQLLGDAMRVLHSHSVILGTNLDTAIRNEIEHIKLYLEPLSLEELTKVWSATTKPMRLSVSYLVSVVQIENLQPRKFPRAVGEPPVGGPRIKAVTFRAPRIDEVRVIRHDDPQNRERRVAYARIGDRLVLRGRDFTANGLRVLLGEDVLAAMTSITPERIEVTIPDDAALQPGATRVVVQNDLLLGEPETPHRGFTSNVAAFVIVPEVSALTLNGNALTVDGTRLWNETLDSLTIIGNEVVKSYTSESAAQIELDLPPLAAGNYLVRVRVNGAESLDEKVLVIP
ncbi:MAG TPA: Pvc16 family protein [Thermoanaerobaculia bacterium]|jgi:hypothetical protein